jgi:hypothetical protein
VNPTSSRLEAPMSKHILESTKAEFLQWFNNQSPALQYQLVTTPYDGCTQLARLRRLHIKAVNDVALKQLSRAGGSQ